MAHANIAHKKVHQGRNIKRFREMLGIKQDALATALGEEWNQKKISILEQKEVIAASVLAPIAIILKVPTEAIQYLDDDSAIRIIANTFSQQEESPSTTAQAIHYPPTFNPFDKMVELYERIIEQQQQTIDKLEQLIHKR